MLDPIRKRFGWGERAAWALIAMLGLGCAASTEEKKEPSPAATSGSGGAGGAGGTGGMGGSTGACAIDCSTINTPACSVAVCNEGSHPGPIGQCVIIDAEDGTPCDDGAFCTVQDSCQAGTCTGGPPNDCGLTAGDCQQVTCDETSQSCAVVPLADGTACTLENLCITGSTCFAGQCTGGAPKDCIFAPVPNECHVAVCNPLNGICEPVPGNDNAPCVDANDLCTVNKTCNAGVCDGGNPKDCSQLTVGCDLGICDTTTGQCTTQTVMNNQPCDDLDACTNGEICTNGQCGGGAAVTVCSQTADGCCPGNCTEANDIDCACTTIGLTTGFTNTSGWDGIMFDVVAVTNIEVKGFEVNIDPGLKTIEIYYKAGTHANFTSTPSAWTLAGSAQVNPVAADVGTPVPIPLAVNIPAGQTYAFYIVSTAGGTLNNGVNYLINITTGTVVTQDSNVQILAGIGRGYPFTGSSFTNRGLSGTMLYEKCGQ